jgi:hypothetical protein
LLGLFAADDGSTAPGESLSAFASSLTDTHTLRVVPGVGHTMRTASDAFPPDYLDLITSWINTQPSSSAADPAPPQKFLSAPVSIPWYRNAFVQTLAFVLLLLGFAFSLLAPLSSRRQAAPTLTAALFIPWAFPGDS